MKIMMIANDSDFIYNLRFEILNHLIQLNHDVFVVCSAINYVEELQRAGIVLINVSYDRRGKNILSDLVLYSNYVKILKSIKPDIVFTNNIKPNIYAGYACRKIGIKYIPNITGLGTPLEGRSVLQPFLKRMYKIGISKAECVFFQNISNLLFFKENRLISDYCRAVLLPGSGVNLNKHQYLDYPNTDEIHFLFVARILKEKGIDILLEVAKSIRSKNQSVFFDICGKCDDDRYIGILSEYENKKIITYYGPQKDLSPFYAGCSCFFYPSFYPEGISNVLLEASACGRPVISTSRPGCAEVIDDGVTGLIIKPNDYEDALRAINQFLAFDYDKRRVMGIKAREKVSKQFDREIVIHIYLDEIDRLNKEQ